MGCVCCRHGCSAGVAVGRARSPAATRPAGERKAPGNLASRMRARMPGLRCDLDYGEHGHPSSGRPTSTCRTAPRPRRRPASPRGLRFLFALALRLGARARASVSASGTAGGVFFIPSGGMYPKGSALGSRSSRAGWRRSPAGRRSSRVGGEVHPVVEPVEHREAVLAKVHACPCMGGGRVGQQLSGAPVDDQQVVAPDRR